MRLLKKNCLILIIQYQEVGNLSVAWYGIPILFHFVSNQMHTHIYNFLSVMEAFMQK